MTSSSGKPCSFRKKPYFAFPNFSFPRFALKTCSTRASRSGPRTTSRPMCPRSKIPACFRTRRASSRIPVYWTGISQPWKSTRRAPASTWAAWSGVCRMGLRGRRGGRRTYHARAKPPNASGVRLPLDDGALRDHRARRRALPPHAVQRLAPLPVDRAVGDEALRRERGLGLRLREPLQVRHGRERRDDEALRDL